MPSFEPGMGFVLPYAPTVKIAFKGGKEADRLREKITQWVKDAFSNSVERVRLHFIDI